MISVLVPYAPDGGQRERSWRWLERRWGTVDVELVLQTGDGTAGAFEQSRAINRAAERAAGDTFVIVDADVALEAQWVWEAANLVESGEAKWILPQRYRQLTAVATDQILNLHPAAPIPPELPTEWLGDGVSWTGGVVLRREAFDVVGGYEERFGGWGGNDVSLGAALDTLWGPLTRLEGEATHLWHPRTGLDAQPQPSHDLMYRYINARGDAEAMEGLIAEREGVLS